MVRHPDRSPTIPARTTRDWPGLGVRRRQSNLSSLANRHERRQTACKPGSVRTCMRDDHSSGTRLAARLTRPTRTARRECPCSLAAAAVPIRSCSRWGLPCAPVARRAVRSCRTVSPLPVGTAKSLRGRFVFCGTFPGVAPAGGWPAPYSRGARTFLCQPEPTVAVRPSGGPGMRRRARGVKRCSDRNGHQPGQGEFGGFRGIGSMAADDLIRVSFRCIRRRSAGLATDSSPRMD